MNVCIGLLSRTAMSQSCRLPDSIINKPDKLTDEEYAQIKTHTTMGDRILRNIRERPKLAASDLIGAGHAMLKTPD